MDITLFFAGVFLLTLALGVLLEKIRIPWIFSALLIGLGLATYNPFSDITSSSEFRFMATLGMYFMLFIIGFELDVKQIFSSNRFIFKTTMAVVFAEALIGSIIIHYIFHVGWSIAVLVAASFATVGEEVLLPILDEFHITKTKLGQAILGVGVLDDVVEVATIVAASVLVGRSFGHGEVQIWLNLAILGVLFLILFTVIKLRKEIVRFKFKDIKSSFLFVMFVFFSFLGLGMFAESAALGALLAGMALKNMLPEKRLKFIESEIITLAYGFFGPLFFVWVGLETDVSYLIKYPLLIILILLMTNFTKIGTSVLVAHKNLGWRQSVVLGIGLCVKFSTSVVIIKYLFEKGLIMNDLYSVLIGTTILFKFIVPFSMSFFIKKWNLSPKKA